MSKSRRAVVSISLLASIFTSIAFAECRRAEVCDGYGKNCRYRDVCDSTMDLPSIGINPLPSIRSPAIK